jgi:hypothetical protein
MLTISIRELVERDKIINWGLQIEICQERIRGSIRDQRDYERSTDFIYSTYDKSVVEFTNSEFKFRKSGQGFHHYSSHGDIGECQERETITSLG